MVHVELLHLPTTLDNFIGGGNQCLHHEHVSKKRVTEGKRTFFSARM